MSLEPSVMAAEFARPRGYPRGRVRHLQVFRDSEGVPCGTSRASRDREPIE